MQKQNGSPMGKLVNIHTHNPAMTEITIRTAGIHPYDAASADATRLEAIEREAAEADAVGEIGLDFACDVSRGEQERVFRAQLAIAERLQKPVVLHCVRAFGPTMAMLDGVRLPAVIFHGFIGSPEQARRAVARGYYLSFGERTFRSPKSIEAMRSTPLSHIFVENDEAPTPIAELYERVAALLGIETRVLEAQTTENFERIFG